VDFSTAKLYLDVLRLKQDLTSLLVCVIISISKGKEMKYMSKVIVYGFKDDKLWMGRPTLLSWLYCFFHRGGMLTVKPIKGFENYAHYPDRLYISFEYCNLTNEDLGITPLASVYVAEHHKGNDLPPLKPFQGYQVKS
jgi:hypothetical protein